VQGTYLTRYKVTEEGMLIVFLIYITIIAWSNSFLCLIVTSICGAATSLPGRCVMTVISISITFFRSMCYFFTIIFIILRLKWNMLLFRKCFNPANAECHKFQLSTKLATPDRLWHLFALYLTYVVKRYLDGSFEVLSSFHTYYLLLNFAVLPLATYDTKLIFYN
jgi:hypothetical protein